MFGILFESDPYDFEADRDASAGYEALFTLSTRRLKLGLRDRVEAMETQLTQLGDSYLALQRQIDSVGEGRDRIPAIQPVINKQLSLLTASYGMRIHPFYKTLQSHQGVDYTVPEGSSVFATADGVVKETATRNSTSGKTVVIDHGNGYETRYANLSEINVQKGQRVRRGDIIALSGNTGLSLRPTSITKCAIRGCGSIRCTISSWSFRRRSTGASSASPSRGCNPSTDGPASN